MSLRKNNNNNNNRDFLFLKDSECHNCNKTNKIIDEVKQQNPGFNIRKIAVESPEGQKLIKEKNIRKIPYVEDCPQNDPDKKSCRIINEHNPSFYQKYLKKK